MMRSEVTANGLLTRMGNWSADSTNQGGEKAGLTQMASHPVLQDHSRRMNTEGPKIEEKARSARYLQGDGIGRPQRGIVSLSKLRRGNALRISRMQKKNRTDLS